MLNNNLMEQLINSTYEPTFFMPRGMKIKCITTGGIYNSLTEAANATGTSSAQISRHLRAGGPPHAGVDERSGRRCTWEVINWGYSH
jgi:hypothetical protein